MMKNYIKGDRSYRENVKNPYGKSDLGMLCNIIPDYFLQKFIEDNSKVKKREFFSKKIRKRLLKPIK